MNLTFRMLQHTPSEVIIIQLQKNLNLCFILIKTKMAQVKEFL